MKAFFKYITNAVWWFIVLSVVFTAVSLVLFKQLSPHVGGYRSHIERNLSQIVGYPISVGYIEASLVGINPKALITDLSLSIPIADNAEVKPFQLDTLSIEVDLLKSLLNLEPTFSEIRFYKPKIQLKEGEEGWAIEGMSGAKSNDNSGFFRALAYLLNQDNMSLWDLEVELLGTNSGVVSLLSDAIYLQKTAKGFGLSGDIKHSNYEQIFNFSGEWVGDLSDPETLRFDAFIKIPSITLPLESILPTELLNNQTMDVAANIWLTYQPNENAKLSGDLTLNMPAFFNNDYKISSDFNLLYGLRDETIDIDLANVSILENAVHYPVSNFSFSSEAFSHEKTISLDFDRFDLPLAHRLFSPLLKPEWFLSKMLSSMQIQGTAENAHLDIWQGENTKFHYRSNIFIESSVGYKSIPGVSDLDAILDINDQGGFIEFSSDNAVLNFPLLLSDALATQGMSGKVSWNNVKDAFVLTGSDLFVKRNGADITGLFRFEAPKGDADTLLLDFHGENVPFSDKLDYIPKNVLPERALAWIQQRVISGKAKEVDFVLQTSLEQEAKSHVLLALDAANAEIKFTDDWPVATEVTANFELDASGIHVDVNNANLDGVETQDLSIHLPFHDRKITNLDIKGRIEDDANEIFALLRTTSLEQNILKPFESWQLAGKVLGDFQINIPFVEEFIPPYISLILDFYKNDLRIDSLNLPIRVHSGHLEYDSEAGISNSSFQISTLGGDANVRLFGIQPLDGPVQITADLQGDADIVEITKWLNFPDGIINSTEGKVNLIGNIDINKYRAGQVDLSFTSNLRGVQFDFPQPLGKLFDERDPISIHIINYNQELITEIEYKAYRAQIGFNQDGFYGGELLINDDSDFSAGIKKGLALKGEIAEYDNRPWLNFFSTEAFTGSKNKLLDLTVPDWLREVDFITDKLILNEKNHLNNVKMLYDAEDPTHGYNVVSDEMSVRITENNHGPIIHFDYFSWNSDDETREESNEQQPFNAIQIPNLTISFDQLYVDSKFYGDWQMVTHNNGNTLRVAPITSTLKNGRFLGSLIWKDTNTPSVTFTLDIEGKKIEEVSTKFSDQPFMSSDEYDLAVTLNWLGSPFTFNNESLSGVIDISAENGRITAIENMPPFLKTLGIFNLNALARRLTLDFSDINLPGLTYDDFTGRLVIKDGILNTVEPLKIVSPTINISLEGTANLIEEVLDERLTASFPLGGALPIAGLLLGATPQVAGLVFLTDKILGDPLSKVTSIEYTVKGPFNAPIIEPVEVKKPPKKRD